LNWIWKNNNTSLYLIGLTNFHATGNTMRRHLPPDIARFIGHATPQRDAVGESPCPVHRFQRRNDVFFLKTSAPPYAPTSYSVARETDVLRWLSGRLRVPELVCAAQHEGYEHMITRALPGAPLSPLMSNERAVVDHFHEALRQVQSVPVANCPFDSSASARLRELDYLPGQGLGNWTNYSN
jgi:aminoglycoside phosphotransferase